MEAVARRPTRTCSAYLEIPPAVLLYFVFAGSGVAIMVSKLTYEHRASRVMLGIFLVLLVIGFAHYFWLGMLPNGLEIPGRVGPSPNRP